MMSAEQQHKQEWIDSKVEDLQREAVHLTPHWRILEQAEAAWQKRNEDGPEDGPGWEGGFAWNH